MKTCCAYRNPLLFAVLLLSCALPAADSNTEPFANPQQIAIDEDTASSFQLTADDGDELYEQVLTYIIVSQPAHGTITGFIATTGALVYTPERDYNGSDSFEFAAADDDSIDGIALTSAPAVVTITLASVNDPPTAANSLFDVVKGTSRLIQLTAHDRDPEVAQALSFEITQQPLKGQLSAFDAATGIVTYTAGIGSGVDQFKFKVTDDDTAGGPPLASNEAFVLIRLKPPPNNPPVAFPVSVWTYAKIPVQIQLLGDDGDPDQEQVVYFNISKYPQAGTLSSISTSARTYTPNNGFVGIDRFEYVASDFGFDGPVQYSAPVTVSITVLPTVTYSPAEPQLGETITFSPFSRVDDWDSSATYLWDFGDGTTSTDPVAQHAFALPGAYWIKLTITVGTKNYSYEERVMVAGEALTIHSLKINFDFRKPERNSLQLDGSLSGVKPGSHVTIDIGGIQDSFVMDARMKTQSGSNTLRFFKNWGDFRAVFRRGDFLAALTDENFSSALTHQRLRLIPITITVDGRVSFRFQQVTYNSPPLHVRDTSVAPKRGRATSDRDGGPVAAFTLVVKVNLSIPHRSTMTFKGLVPRAHDEPKLPFWVDIAGFRFANEQNPKYPLTSGTRWRISFVQRSAVREIVAEWGMLNESIDNIPLDITARVNGRVYTQVINGSYTVKTSVSALYSGK